MFLLDDLLLGLTLTAAGAGISAALAPSAPGVSLDNGAATRATAATLPAQRQLAAAEQQGTRLSIPTGRTVQQTRRVQTVELSNGELIEYHAEDWQPGGKYYDGQNTPRINTSWNTITENVPEVIDVDFTGYGDADVQAKIADQMAGLYLQLGEEYGPKFIAEAQKQLELADPEGVAARKKLFDLTQQQADRTPVSPVATMLNKQVTDQLNAGRGLTEQAGAQADAAVAEANAARGDSLDKELLKRTMAGGIEGDQRQAAAIQKGMGWLSSGLSPEDVDYRARQQNMANMANFMQGRTPTSQFASLGNAQRGATPLAGGQALPQVQNQTQQFNQLALGGWNTTLQNQANQANPWMAGLSSLLGVGNMIASGTKN